MGKTLLNEIMNIPQEHDGLVPCLAAKEAGISASALVKMAARGRLERVARGVYRVPFFPSSSASFSDYHEAISWARAGHGPTAVISHESALAIYGISDALPANLHITIPAKSRFQRRTIPTRFIIHHADLTAEEITIYEGIPVTTIERTIQDVINIDQTDFAVQAIRDARRQKYIDKNTAIRLSNFLKRQKGKSKCLSA